MAYFDCIVGGSGKGNTLVVTCADELAGATITCTNGTKTYTKTCPSTSPYEVTFYGLMAGTWTVSATVSGNTYTTTVVVVDCAALLGGFNWRTWVDTASQLDSSDYNSLDEVLADEKAVRELCLEHACVDYMAEIATDSTDVETIINTDLFAKWVNNSDYALDFLHANQIIAGYMDDADKYGYGEWVITDDTTTPPTWGAKGNVPVMTSDTAPYGEVIGSTPYQSYYRWQAFYGDGGYVTTTTSNAFIGYKFINPCCIRKVVLSDFDGGSSYKCSTVYHYKIQASNDNFVNDIHDLASGENEYQTGEFGLDKFREYTFDNDNYYLYYRYLMVDVFPSGKQKTAFVVNYLQFYGREIKVSVPTMTSDTTPYGEVSGANLYNNANAPWRFFDGLRSTQESSWVGFNASTGCVIYDFKKKIVPKMYGVQGDNDAATYPHKILELYGSNDLETWETLGNDSSIIINVNDGWKYANTNNANNKEFRYFMLKNTEASQGGFANGQIYGLDYSEKEFEEGSTKKWLYDHGVKLVDTYDGIGSTAGCSVEYRDYEIVTRDGSGNSAYTQCAMVYFPQNGIDLSNYSFAKSIVGDMLVNTSGTGQYANMFCGVSVRSAKQSGTYSDDNLISTSNGVLPITNLEFTLDISSVNQSAYINVGSGYWANQIVSYKEIWLE